MCESLGESVSECLHQSGAGLQFGGSPAWIAPVAYFTPHADDGLWFAVMTVGFSNIKELFKFVLLEDLIFLL